MSAGCPNATVKAREKVFDNFDTLDERLARYQEIFEMVAGVMEYFENDIQTPARVVMVTSGMSATMVAWAGDVGRLRKVVTEMRATAATEGR